MSTNTSPLERVREEHGSKERLAGKLLGVLETPDDVDAEEFDDRIHKLSNKKLLRLWDAKETVEEEFGSKEDLIDQITQAKFAGGNEDYSDKLSTYTLPKLLGLAREIGLLND